MKLLISAQEIRSHLQNIMKYFVYDESVKPRIDKLVAQTTDNEDVSILALKYEKETDDFIRSISELMEFDREDTLAVVSKASDQVLLAFTIRVFTIDQFLIETPDKPLPISSDNSAFFCDCLINYWQALMERGDINFLNI